MENEVLYQISYQQNIATMRAVYRGLMRNRRRIMIPLLSVLFGLSLVGNLINFQGMFPTLGLVLMLLFLLYIIFLPHLYALHWKNQHRRMMGEETGTAVLRFTDKEIEGVEQRNTQYFQYAQITSIRKVGRMWLLMLGRNIAIPVPMDNFTKGRSEDFPAFIRSKCATIKGF